MNNKGQTLVLLVVIIPLFALLATFAIDSGLMIKEKNKLTSVTKMIIKESIPNLESTTINEDIKNLYVKNDMPVDNLKVILGNQRVTIENYYSINSLFGYLIGYDKYKVSIKLTGYDNNGNIIIEKG